MELGQVGMCVSDCRLSDVNNAKEDIIFMLGYDSIQATDIVNAVAA